LLFMKHQFFIPVEVSQVTKTLENEGFLAYLVGGCVRDLLMDRKPKDWDITTNAIPEQIISFFPKTVYENIFGTVAVTHETVSDETAKIIEVTPFRIEGKYSDNRHPDSIIFSQNIEDDLKRRDFTINALALDSKGQIIDLYKGQEDIKDKIIRSVGNANERFREDALRMLRAVRFAVQLGFEIDPITERAIVENSHLIKAISIERIRDEFTKIVVSREPAKGIRLLHKYGLLKYFIPELEEGVGVEQKGEHIYDVFEHMLHALDHAAQKEKPFDICLSALFHDIGKPRTRRWDGSKAGGRGKYTFYGHEVVGARMVRKIMERLKFSRETGEKVEKLVRHHMFFSDTEQITLSAVRRTIVNVGRENIWDLMEVRECDRVGMKKKEAPYRLRKYHAMIEEALRAPTSVGMLKIDGAKLMEIGIQPGPRMGWMLHALLEECLTDDSKNTPEYLVERARELDALSDIELRSLGDKGKEKKEEAEEAELAAIRKKHFV
jgi:putative nucleotidyltransferase with HDIG domain